MIGIVIVAHGGLAEEYKSAVEHVVGKQDGIFAIPVQADHDRSKKESEIREAAEKADTGNGVVVVVDMFGGSPSTLSVQACETSKRRVRYGANLPMLVKLAKGLSYDIETAISKSVQAGRKYLDCLPASS